MRTYACLTITLLVAVTLAICLMPVTYAQDTAKSSNDDLLRRFDDLDDLHQYFDKHIKGLSSSEEMIGFKAGYKEHLPKLPQELHQKLTGRFFDIISQNENLDRLRATLKGIKKTRDEGFDLRLLDKPYIEFFVIENEYLKDVEDITKHLMHPERYTSQPAFSVNFYGGDYPNIHPTGLVSPTPLRNLKERFSRKHTSGFDEGESLGEQDAQIPILDIGILVDVVKAEIRRKADFENDQVTTTQELLINYYIVDARGEKLNWVKDSRTHSRPLEGDNPDNLSAGFEYIISHFIDDSKAKPEETDWDKLLTKIDRDERIAAGLVDFETGEKMAEAVSVVHIIDKGSGFYICENQVLTNRHVVEDSVKVKIENHDGSKEFIGVVSGSDVRRDLALLETEQSGTPMPFHNSESLNTGSSVEAIGYPVAGGLSRTQGIISRFPLFPRGEAPDLRVVQTDAEIDSGNSGGPLVLQDSRRVVGVNTWTRRNHSLSVDYREVLDFLRQQGVEIKDGVCQE